MTVWAYAYAALFSLVGITSAIDDVRHGRGREAAIDLVVMSALGALFCSYFVPVLANMIGKLGVPVLIGSFIWLGASARRQLNTAAHDPGLPARLHDLSDHVTMALSALFFSPAIAFGGMAAIRSW